MASASSPQRGRRPCCGPSSRPCAAACWARTPGTACSSSTGTTRCPRPTRRSAPTCCRRGPRRSSTGSPSSPTFPGAGYSWRGVPAPRASMTPPGPGLSWCASRATSTSAGARTGTCNWRRATMSDSPFYSREEPNLSVAWARAFLGLLDHARKEYTPFLVNISSLRGCDPQADADLRQVLDACLEASGHDRVQTVANTIFPQSMWRRAKGDREALYRQYLEDLPSFAEMDGRNRRGTYFSRLIGFAVSAKDGSLVPHAPSKALA